MPWRSTSVNDERIRFVLAAHGDKMKSLSRLCQEFGVSRPTGYRWLERYQQSHRLSDVVERSRRPLRSPNRLSDDLISQIVSLRLTFDWGARKLQVMLAREGYSVSTSSINRILRQHDLIRESQSHSHGITRFERSLPNQLWQMDFKGAYDRETERCYPLSIIDDHSRYVTGLFALQNQQTGTVAASLLSTFEQHGLPEAILVDHGTPWWSTSNGHGLTRLTVSLIRQGIRLIFSGIRHPQTQGKVERFHRTLASRMNFYGHPRRLTDWQQALDTFAYEYNHVRPHEALQMAVPASRYQPSKRRYQAVPPEWEYPAGSDVRRLNAQGSLDWPGGRFFVCEALANEQVSIQRCQDQLLIRYRNIIVREINCTTGQSLPLILTEQNPYV